MIAAKPPPADDESLRHRPSLERKLLVLLAGSVVALLVAETAFRVRVHRRNQALLDTSLSQPLPADRPPGLIDIIQHSSNERIVYELKPNLRDLPFKSRTVSTNGLGFRSPEIAPAPAPGTITLVGLGDSVLFGHGVGDGETFLDRLAAKLAAAHPEREWRYANTGVPGYNTVMEVETLRTKGLVLAPDLVILSLVPNDLELPVYLSEEEDVLDLRRSFLLDFLRFGLRSARAPKDGSVAYLGRDGRLMHVSEIEPESLPPRYRRLQGLEPFREALDELRSMAEEHGFAVLVFANVEDQLTRDLMAEAAERGFPCVSLMEDLVAYMWKEHGNRFSAQTPGGYARSKLVVSRNNAHPSALQHEMAAEKLFHALRELGLLDALLAGS